jgi:hypothetical protein
MTTTCVLEIVDMRHRHHPKTFVRRWHTGVPEQVEEDLKRLPSITLLGVSMIADVLVQTGNYTHYPDNGLYLGGDYEMRLRVYADTWKLEEPKPSRLIVYSAGTRSFALRATKEGKWKQTKTGNSNNKFFDVKIRLNARFYQHRDGTKEPYHLITFKDQGETIRLATNRLELLEYIINNWATRVERLPDRYRLKVTKNVLLAFQYVKYKFHAPTKTELVKIIKTGTTRIHHLLESLGAKTETKLLVHLPWVVNGKLFSLEFSQFPRFSLVNDQFNMNGWYKESNIPLLQKILDAQENTELFNTLFGIGQLTKDNKNRYFQLFLEKQLSKNMLAKAMCQSAIRDEQNTRWRQILTWLEKNGYAEYADTVIVRKTLVTP